jgi:hypothetical protein
MTQNDPRTLSFSQTRIDWLTTRLQVELREDAFDTNGYVLEITTADPEIILIYMPYQSDVNRSLMNMSIDTAREVIRITANSYGWDKWVKIRGDVQLARGHEKK